MHGDTLADTGKSRGGAGMEWHKFGFEYIQFDLDKQDVYGVRGENSLKGKVKGWNSQKESRL